MEDSIDNNNIEPLNTPAAPEHKKKKKVQQHHTKIPFFITNLSSTTRVIVPKDHIVGFITPKIPETNYVEISEFTVVEEQCKNWVAPK